MTDRIEIQPGVVRLRHIKRGLSTDQGAVQVAGVWLVPQDITGVNGERGFSRGSFVRKEGEEGSFSITFPNTQGEDSVLHRQRFDLITDPAYHVCDEWIEIYRRHDLIFVGTPTQYTITRAEVTLTGYDAFYMLKKQRETGFGSWVATPREVWESYSGIWQARVADDFSTQTWTYSTSITDTGEYEYRAVEQTGNGRISLTARLPGTSSYVQSGINGVDIAKRDGRWRCEFVVFRTTFDVDTELTIGVRDVRNVTDPANASAYLYAFRVHENTTFVDGQFGTGGAFGGSEGLTNVKLDTDATAGSYVFAIERKGNWIAFYVNEKVVSIKPITDDFWFSSTPVYLTPFAELLNSVTGTNDAVEIDLIAFRERVDFLQHPVAATVDVNRGHGTKALGGVLGSGGLKVNFYDDTDLYEQWDTGYPWYALAPDRSPYSTQLLDSVQHPYSSTVKLPPPGAEGKDYTSWRYTGAIYLDLATSNYMFSIQGKSGRLMIGDSTRGRSQIEYFEASNITMVDDEYNGNLADPSFIRGTSLDQLPSVSGWYPIIVEGLQSGVHGFRLTYMKEGTGAHITVGAGRYPEQILADGAVRYWQLQEGSQLMRHEDSARSSYNPTAVSHMRQRPTAGTEVFYGPGIRRGRYGRIFNGTDQYTDVPLNTDQFLAAPFTFEAWVRPENNGTNNRTIFSSTRNNTGVQILVTAPTGVTPPNTLRVTVGTGATTVTVNAAANLMPQNQWKHVVVTVTGTVVNAWINGVQVMTNLAATYARPTLADSIWRLGAAGTGTTPADPQSLFKGRMSDVAFYSGTLTTNQINDHYGMSFELPNDGTIKLAPLGIYENESRFESFYDQILALRETFGYQTTCVPKQLESGSFPGSLVPETRIGRDTEYILEEEEATDLQATGTVEDTVDTLLADAQGIADPNSDAQITTEAMYTPRMIPGQHIGVLTEYESMGDISERALFFQRVTSMLGLRASTWENVQAQPPGYRHLIDTFPLTGNYKEFAWEPGDGIRRNFPTIGVEDEDPIQFTTVEWPFTPNGLGRPSIGFRSRNRDLKATLRRLSRTLNTQVRNYQGTLHMIVGEIGQVNDTGMDGATLYDGRARIALPEDITRVVKMWVVVMEKPNREKMTYRVNGDDTLTGTFSKTGRYPITRWVRRLNGDQPKMYVSVIGATNYAQYRLEMLVRG